MDKIVVQSNFPMGSSVKMPDMAKSMVITAQLLFPGGPHAQVYFDQFDRHDILKPPHPVIVLDSVAAVAESCSPANGVPDPGERLTCAVSLKNAGTADAEDLVVAIEPVGGVTSPSGPRNYGTVAYGGAPVSRDFTFTVDPSRACGGTLALNLRMADGPEDMGVLPVVLPLGRLVAAGSFTSGNVSEAIPDNDPAGVTVLVRVTGEGAVGEVRVKIRLDHTCDSDLVMTVTAPDGTVAVLTNRHGLGDQNFGAGAADCTGVYCEFDDGAAASIADSSSAFVGPYRPESPLAVFIGKPAAGDWVFKAVDKEPGNTGTVYCVAIDVSNPDCCTPAPPCAIASCDAWATAENPRVPLRVTFNAAVATENCHGEPALAWDFGDGATGVGTAVTHTYTTAGPKTWTMTATIGGATCRKTGLVGQGVSAGP